MRQIGSKRDILYICNPITREYIKFPSPERMKQCYPAVVSYGFGVNGLSGQHKVVRIFHNCVPDPETDRLVSVEKSECQV